MQWTSEVKRDIFLNSEAEAKYIKKFEKHKQKQKNIEGFLSA